MGSAEREAEDFAFSKFKLPTEDLTSLLIDSIETSFSRTDSMIANKVNILL